MATDTASSRYSKARGYNVEVAAATALREAFPKIRRVGSPGYSKAHADLVQDGDGIAPPLRLVVTKAKGKTSPMLVTLSMEDFLEYAGEGIDWVPVYVQCKGIARSYIDTVYRELREATK